MSGKYKALKHVVDGSRIGVEISLGIFSTPEDAYVALLKSDADCGRLIKLGTGKGNIWKRNPSKEAVLTKEEKKVIWNNLTDEERNAIERIVEGK